MTLKELRFFYNLCENPHISELAKKISMSQSAISLSIKSLEKKLNEPLFDRIGKKLVLNERGREFYDKTYNHFLGLEDAKNIFLKDKISGILHISSSKTIGNFVLPQILFDFLTLYPNSTIKNDIKNSTKIIQMVIDGKIDIGFIESTCDEIDILKQKIGSDTLIIVSSDKELTKKSYYIDELFYKKWILREKGSGTREVFLDTIGDVSHELKIFMEYSQAQEAISILTQNKDAITCISKYAVKKELNNQELYQINIKNIIFKRDFYIIYHKNKYHSELFKQFEGLLNNPTLAKFVDNHNLYLH